MRTHTHTDKPERLETRIPAAQKALLQRAAALQGQTLSNFILEATLAKARLVIRDRDIIDLSQSDQVAFAEALLNPPKPNAKLKKATDSYMGEAGK